MKKILITGAKSFIGVGVENYLQQYNAKSGKEEYRVDTVMVRGASWEKYDFSGYDAVFHVAGIATVDLVKISEERKEEYYRVNRDLALQVAQKAKAQGVKQFIFMSSMWVHGDDGRDVKKSRSVYNAETPVPDTHYGASKLQAEQGLRALETREFYVASIRCPMVYGPGGHGSYKLLAKAVHICPVFPDVKNKRSAIYIDNLAEFVRLLVENGKGGTFYPQNREYVSTAMLAKTIAEVHGRKLYMSKSLAPFVWVFCMLPGKTGMVAKGAFRTFVVDHSLSNRTIKNYQIVSFEESIRHTEGI